MKQLLEREEYKPDDNGLPELEMFGWTATRYAGQLPLGPHRHRNAYEICLIVDGTVQWWVGHEVYQLTRGDIYITRPNETHGGIDDIMHPCTIYWAILPTPGRKPLPGLSLKHTRELMRTMSRLSLRSFPASAELRHAFARLHGELKAGTPLALIAARAALHSLLVQLLRDHEQAKQTHATGNLPRSPVMQQAIQWLADHMADEVAVEQCAAHVGLSVSRFHERFVAEVGLTPAAYRTHLRIRQARQLLKQTPRSVTHIAHQLGFSTSQYFATVFKKIVGMTPVQYRRRLTRSPDPTHRV